MNRKDFFNNERTPAIFGYITKGALMQHADAQGFDRAKFANLVPCINGIPLHLMTIV